MEVVIVVFISFILGLSILFEYGREYLRESTAEVFQPILTSLYSELTLLGFIGLILFATFKMDSVGELSFRLFGTREKLAELGEQVHMVLFLVMVVFLLQAVAMARFGENTQRKWHLWEARPLLNAFDEANGYRAFRSTYHQAVRKTSFTSHLVSRTEEKVREFQHSAVRREFVREAKLASDDFDFARYLSVALGAQLGELVEVPVPLWFVLELVLLFFWQCELLLGPNARIAVWTTTGFLLAVASYAVHAKIRLILHDYTAPLVEEQHGYGSSSLRRSSVTALFWCGNRKWTFDGIRLVSLLTSIYAAIFLICYLDPLVIRPVGPAAARRGGRLGGVFIVLAACAPPFVVVLKIRHILEDYAVAGNVADAKNHRYIEQVMRRQKTVRAFEALKVVQCLRKPEMLVRVSKQLDVDPSESHSPSGLRGRLAASRRRASYRALKQLQTEEQQAFHIRQRANWKRIFQLFDADDSGQIAPEQFRRLLEKFGCRITPSDLKDVFDALDTDRSGAVTLDEFSDFALKLSVYLAAQHDTVEDAHAALAKDMFALIDTDNSKAITVHEMHRVVADKLGQDLSVEDVFNVIQHIDQDGNGELDLSEFIILLDRFGLFHSV